MQRIVLCLAALLGAIGVTLGAFAAHFLKRKLSGEMLTVFETGVRYQMYHVFALFIAAWALGRFPHSPFTAAAWAFILGVLLFSGSLYILATTTVRQWGMVTPVGGVLLILGWLLLFLGFWKADS